MINKSIFVTFLFLLIIIGCESPNESYIEAEQYYPMKIGNKWYYSTDQFNGGDYNMVKEIVKDTIINNRLYYKLISYYTDQSTNQYVSYLRIEKSRLFIGINVNKNGNYIFEENLSADFSIKLGDTLRVDNYEYYTVVEKSENIINIFHQQSDGIRSWTKYQKGIGIIEGMNSNAIIHKTILVKSELK